MANAALMAACQSFFSDHDLVAAAAKGLLLDTNSPKGADPIRMAEIRAAIDLLHNCMISGTGAGNQGRLTRAEEICLRELQRPFSLPKGAWQHARMRFVLAAINHIRGEPEVCAAHITHAFAVEPRWSRVSFPSIFLASFQPGCSSLYDRLKQDETKIWAKSYLGLTLAQRTAAIAVGVGLVTFGALIGLNGGASRGLVEPAKLMWRSAEREQFQKAEVGRLRRRFEDKLNRECRSMALQML